LPLFRRVSNQSITGGKAKPLKAAKKEKKELDEDDKAYLEKKKAGMSNHPNRR
jgi:hypothetical protein